MAAREEVISKLRGVPADLPPLAEVLAMLEANPGMKCVICYARISDDARAKDAHGIEDQHRELSDKAREFGWLMVHRYTDNDKSASKENVIRDDFEQMLVDLAAGKTAGGYPVHGVMAVNDDRLYRRPGDWERYLRAFTAHEGRVYWDSNGLQDLYAEGFEIKGLIGVAMSLAETRKKQRRARASHRNRAIRGQSVSAWRPFGWEDDKIALRPVEAEAIRKAVHDVISGASVSEITQRWKEAGYLTARGNLFQYQSVKQVLMNARICGYREVNGELVRDSDDQPIVGEWDAIVTPKEWFAVVAAIRGRGRAGQPGGKLVHKYLLTGILRCGNTLEDGTKCNHPMKGQKANEWVKYEHGYFCKKTVDGGCNGTYKRGDETDKHITKLVLAKLKADAAAAVKDVPDWGREDELQAALQRRATLELRWNAGEIDDEGFFRNLPVVEKTIKELRADQAKNIAAKAAAEEATADVDREWKSKTIRQKRELIKKVLHAVIAFPGGMGNKPFDVEQLIPVWRSAESAALPE
ncbi:recombinase family protein [Kitasatospora saccharophila]|uniref:Recombinase family protein n=1 Tax=Kitasatospora saccharophila TaxID=407973 RepID=A0ABP5IRQ6_9ACTN